jgi:hypothetical protein
MERPTGDDNVPWFVSGAFDMESYSNRPIERRSIVHEFSKESINGPVIHKSTTPIRKCRVCKAKSTTRCSRCKNVYYCGVECQTKHWKEHKKNCTK